MTSEGFAQTSVIFGAYRLDVVLPSVKETGHPANRRNKGSVPCTVLAPL